MTKTITESIVAIPTRYAGVQFRSRLEARWAAFFDLVSWRWEYEPVDLFWYVPDFVLRFPRGLVLAEVKPAKTPSELLTFAPRIEGAGWDGELLLLGASHFEPSGQAAPSIGLYSQFEEGPDGPQLGRFDHAVLHRCLGCGAISFHHASGDWRCAVSGCSDGNALVDIIEPHTLRAWWVEAGNKAQWKPSSDDLPVEMGR